MECLFYNGETGCYELLEFDPRGLNKTHLIEKVKQCFKDKYLSRNDIDRALETVYLLEVRHLKKVTDLNKGRKEWKIICSCGETIEKCEMGVNGTDFCKCLNCRKEYNTLTG